MATNSSSSSSKLRTRRTKWEVTVSAQIKATVNPIRSIVETLKLEPNPEKQLIPLSIGMLKKSLISSKID